MRLPDWVARLWETVHQHERQQFFVGRHDCALFAGRCVDAMTGANFCDGFGYGDKRSAIRVLRESGGLEAAVSKRLGAPIDGHASRRGDVCLIDKRTLGVCLGATVAVCADDGLTYLPIARVRKHWRIE